MGSQEPKWIKDNRARLLAEPGAVSCADCGRVTREHTRFDGIGQVGLFCCAAKYRLAERKRMDALRAKRERAAIK